MSNKILISLFIFFLNVVSVYAQEYKAVTGIVDLHSNISDGVYSPEDIVKLAKEKDIAVLIFADAGLRKWEYGLWPLRNLVKKTIQEKSVLHFGVKRYLEKIDALGKKSADLVIIPGLEVCPFYYWKGNPFLEDFSLNDWYKQFLIFGLNQKDYQNLPIIGNWKLSHSFKKELFSLWPMPVIIFGLWLLRKKRVGSLEYKRLVVIRTTKPYKILGISFIVMGVLFFINNFSLCTLNFNPYQGKPMVEPYQEVINYVNQRGGLIFWAHPDMESLTRYKGIKVYTPAHSENLILTEGYTGFGVTYTDRLKVIEVGSVWDKALLEYIKGKRKKPVWIIGSLHYDGPMRTINAVETIFFLKELTQRELLDALREGRMYVRFNLGKEPLILEEFSVKPIEMDSVQIIIRGRQAVTSEPAVIEIIRNSQNFKTLTELREEFTLIEKDTLSPQEQKVCYRIRINSSQSIILSNPVFVQKKTSDK